MNKTIPMFDRKVTKISQVNPRLEKLFPDKEMVVYRESTSSDIYIVWPEIENNKPVIKRAYAWCWRLYSFDLIHWNEMLQHIDNDFIFPGDPRFQCYQCGCPDIKNDPNTKYCLNCKEAYKWHIL